MRNRLWSLVALAIFLSPAYCQEVWQTDWNAFIDELSPLLKRSASTAEIRAKFEGKEVVWDGIVESIAGTTGAPLYRMTMPKRTVTLSTGVETDDIRLALSPSSANVASWSSVGVGSQVRFKTTLQGSSIFAVVTVVVGVGPNAGQVFVFVSTNDAAVVSRQTTPFIQSGGVVDGASFRNSISSGSWIAIKGGNLSASTRTWTPQDFRGNELPLTLDGVSVKVNGRGAPVYFVSPTQINALAPEDDALGSVSVEVSGPNGAASSTAVLQRYSPGLFTIGSSATYVAAVHLDGTLVGPPSLFGGAATTKPAAPGERILVFGSGFGPTSPGSNPAQVLASPASLSSPNDVAIRIGGITATVEFAGMVSNGLYQFNVVVPAAAPSGDQAIVVEIGGRSTQASAVITIERPSGVLEVLPAAVSFAFASGEALSSKAIRVSNLGAPIDVSIAAATTSGGNWLTVNTTRSTTPSSISVSADPTGLAPGNYRGTITLQGSGEQRTLPVSLTVVASGQTVPLYTAWTIAGTGRDASSGDGGPASQASLSSPELIKVTASGRYLFVANFGSQANLRRIDLATGIISTIPNAGLPIVSGGMAIDSKDNIYVSSFSGTGRVVKIDATTLRGSPMTLVFNQGPGFLEYPKGLAVEPTGNLLIVDRGNHRIIRRIDVATGVVTTVAGGLNAPFPGFAGDGGPATRAQLYDPEGVASDSAGNFYITDPINLRVRKVTAGTGTITTISGNGQKGSAGDGGPAIAAQMFEPYAIASGASGNLFFTEYSLDRGVKVRRIDARGIVNTVVGGVASGFGGDGARADQALIDSGGAEIAVDSLDNIYLADRYNHRVRLFTPNR